METMEDVLNRETGKETNVEKDDVTKLMEKELGMSSQVIEVIQKYDALLMKQGMEYSSEILDLKSKLKGKTEELKMWRYATVACAIAITGIATIAVIGVFI